MSFWLELNDETGAVAEAPPPLTDETVAACERKFGVKFPASLLNLLKTRNGGCPENSDFRVGSEVYNIASIMGLSDSAEYGFIRPLIDLMDPEFLEDEIQEIRETIGDPSRILPFEGDGHYWYALNYNELNREGEPTVICLVTEGGMSVDRVADSFGQLLAGQYGGDEAPTVQMDEASRYRIIAEGGYEGKLHSTGAAIHVSWKICSHRSRLIVFQREDWGWGEKLERSEFPKSALVLAAMRLEDYGVEVEPELASLIRSTVEAKSEIQKYDVGTTPVCYELYLQTPMADGPRVARKSSESYKGRWKNDSTRIVYARVYSDSKTGLQKTLQSVAENSTGWKRFFS